MFFDDVLDNFSKLYFTFTKEEKKMLDKYTCTNLVTLN